MVSKTRTQAQFSKIKGGSEPTILGPQYTEFLKLCKKLHLIKLITVRLQNIGVTELVKLGVFLAGNTVAMVTYFLTKIITTCLPMIGQFF